MKTRRPTRSTTAHRLRYGSWRPRFRQVTLKIQLPRTVKGWLATIFRTRVRVALIVIVGLLLVTEFIPIFEPRIKAQSYDLTSGTSLLSQTNPAMSGKIKHDTQKMAYLFNDGYKPGSSISETSGGAKISATAYDDPTKGISVTDPTNDVDVGLVPKFDLQAARRDANRIYYPFTDGTGWLVYTMQAGQAKEDILLRHSPGDHLALKYSLNLGDGLEARLEKSGGIGVYGSSLPINGNISTGSDKDAQLLQKARKNAKKDKLLFVIPAPTVAEQGKSKSTVNAQYHLTGSQITVDVTGLNQASYPLSIDPSVYVTSAAQFMQGNNESGIDFDVANDLIQKSKLSGARIAGWTSSLALGASRWSSGYAAGGGFAYVVGGLSGGTAQSSVYWAQAGSQSTSTDHSVSNPTPGTGVTCTNWCTNSAYNLPATRSALSSVVYNGVLYAIGGTDSSCAGTNNVCSTVYYAKLGANGEPISWNTTSTLVTARRFAGVVAYNNKLYMLGGQTNATLNGDTTIESTSINPDGTLGTWAASSTAMPSARWGMTAQQYNGYLYVIGGASTTTAQNSVQYLKINTDGTLSSTWITTSTFTNARMAFGGTFAAISSGYLYITTGCTTLTTTACSTFTAVTFTGSPNTQTDFQYASINADGSLTGFTISSQKTTAPTVSGTPLTSAAGTAMTGYGLLAWRGALYGIGGCTAVSTATNCSGTTQTQTKYGAINDDGDVSPIFGSSSSDYTNGTNYLYNLPAIGTGTSQGGVTASGVVVNNGYIYNIGGCADEDCNPMSDRTSYSKINSDGTLSAPGTCTGTLVNTGWCLDTTHLLPAAIGAMGVTVYNNVIYTVGGFTGSANTRNGYHISLSANGSLNTGGWTTDSNVIPTAAGYVYIFARAIPNNGTQSYLYTIGGCTGTTGIGCSGYVATVQRCTITNTGSAPGSCTTTGQQQLKTLANGHGGTGIFGGAVYGNYVYLAGGANSMATTDVTATGSTCTADPTSCGGQMDIIQYAKIDASGNITRADGTVVTGNGTTATWNVASSRMTEERRRTTAFAINGYFYVVAGHNGTAPAHTLNDIQRGKINVNTGDITGFQALTTTISDRWDLRAAQANGYIYILGGCTTGDPPASCTAMNGMGEYVQIYNNWSGSPASYTSSSNVPGTDRYGAGATVLNGYLYLAGGCTSVAADCSNSTSATMTNNVAYAPLNADGSIGTWVTNATYNLPQALGWGRLENVGGTLYFIGGQTGAGVSQSTVYYSTPSSGAPAAWSTATNALPAARARLNTAVYNNRIYVTGGSTSTSGTADTNTVYYSPTLSSGGNITSGWTTNSNSFQLARSGTVTVAYGNDLYVMGGFDGTNYLLDVQYAPINADGSVGTWTFGTSLPQTIRQGDGFATNGFMYIFGGRSTVTTPTNNTYNAPINSDGSLGTWSQTSTAFTTTRFGVAAAYDSGRTYLLGGATYTGSAYALTSTNSAIYGTLQLQPQTASYSLKIDTDTNVFPSKYLINGLDSGIGAGWYLQYVSSASATNSWGQSTNAGKVALGTPGTYTPLNGSGTNLNTTTGARYYMMFLKIDDQNAFGYPEDISQGPNIQDITLQSTTDPSKRLRNGKTFTGGVQQPLDTPF